MRSQAWRPSRFKVPLTIGLIAVCGLLSWVVSLTTSTSLLNAYLATTPGGINSVLVTSFAAGANTSLVFGIQGLRLIVMVLAAPPLVSWLLRLQRRSPSA